MNEMHGIKRATTVAVAAALVLLATGCGKGRPNSVVGNAPTVHETPYSTPTTAHETPVGDSATDEPVVDYVAPTRTNESMADTVVRDFKQYVADRGTAHERKAVAHVTKMRGITAETEHPDYDYAVQENLDIVTDIDSSRDDAHSLGTLIAGAYQDYYDGVVYTYISVTVLSADGEAIGHAFIS